MLYRIAETGAVFAIVGFFLMIGFAEAGEAKRGEPSKPLRAGIIGLDTSHVVAFTQFLNAARPRPGLEGVRVVAAYPGGSLDIPTSRDRVAGYTKELRDKFEVAIVDSIDELLLRVDVVLLEPVVRGRLAVGDRAAATEQRPGEP